MDPPSYGRGPDGEMWKIEEAIYPLAMTCAELLEAPLFFIINSYTTGLAPSVLQGVLRLAVVQNHGGEIAVDEIGLPATKRPIVLPCGATGRVLWG
jgi:23S rRNA (cytosine1962-C5)-methyltransferase